MTTRIKTQWTVWHRCGHPQDYDLTEVAPNKRAGRAAWLKEKDCTKCWKEAQGTSSTSSERSTSAPAMSATPREETVRKGPAVAYATSGEWVQRRPLPELEGSPAQIAWADDVRSWLVTKTWEALSREGMRTDTFAATIEAKVWKRRSAKWWIEHRELTPSQLVDALEDVSTSPEVTNGTSY